MAGSVLKKINPFYNEHIIPKNSTTNITPPPPVEEKRDAASREEKVRALVLSIIVESRGDVMLFFDDIFLKGKYKTQAQLQALDLYQKRVMAHYSLYHITRGINLLVEGLKKTLLNYDKPENDGSLEDLNEAACLEMLIKTEQNRIAFKAYQTQIISLNQLQEQLLKKSDDKEVQNLNFQLSQSIMALQSALLAQALKQPTLIAETKSAAESNAINVSPSLLEYFADYTAAVIQEHLNPTTDNIPKIDDLKNKIMTHPEYAALDFRKRQMLLNITSGIIIGLAMGLLLATLTITAFSILSSGDQLLKAAMYIHQHMSICNSLFYDGIVVPGLIVSAAGMGVGGASTAFTIYKGPKHHECVGLQDELFTAAIERADAAKPKLNVM